MRNLFILSVIASIFIGSFSMNADARPGRDRGDLVNIAHVINSAAVATDKADMIKIYTTGIYAAGFPALQRMADGCSYGSESEQAQCLRFGIIRFFTNDRMKVVPRRAFRIIQEACMASVTWKGEATCFDWGTLAIKGPVFTRTQHCRQFSEAQAKSYCYRDAI